MMITNYIKAVDEAAMWAALEAAGVVVVQQSVDEEGQPVGDPSYSWPGYDLDIIGIMYKDSGQVDADGNPVMVLEDGYFSNLRMQDGKDITDEQKAALPLIPEPTNPLRMWAGD